MDSVFFSLKIFSLWPEKRLCLHSVGSFSVSPASPSSWLLPHVTVHSVVPPDLPDNLFPLLSHLVQMVKLYGVACQSPFGRLHVTAGPMAREGPPTRAATGEKRRTWSWPKSQSGGRTGGGGWEIRVGLRSERRKKGKEGRNNKQT